MSLKKKITLSFLISVFIIVLLAAFEYINFIEIKKEIRVIEFTDTVRNKSLQIRRHEKNYFLKYSKAKEESEAVHKYLYELNSIMNEGSFADRVLVRDLKASIKEYEQNFNTIELLARDLSGEFEEIKTSHSKWSELFPLIEAILIEHPLQGIALLEKSFSLPAENSLMSGLKELDSHIDTLRKNGEDILTISEELDRNAREQVEKTIRMITIRNLYIFASLFYYGGGNNNFF